MSKTVNVAFIGNPNCGKTTLFNAYTGARLKVANWPGVTVEKKKALCAFTTVRINSATFRAFTRSRVTQWRNQYRATIF